MKQNIVKTLFIAICAMAALPTFAYDCEVDGIYYFLYDESESDFFAVVTNGDDSNRYSGAITIPASINYSGKNYSVISIGVSAFEGCSSLTSISIPNSVTSIYNSAFLDCSSLTSISIPNSVTSIGPYAFSGCTGLTSITIPNSVTYIGDGAFSGCTGLTSITIPNSVTNIYSRAFQNCTNLNTVTLNSDALVSADYEASKTISYLFGNQVKEYIIGDAVKRIGSYAFYDCGVKSVTLSEGLREVGYSAFVGCELGSVTIPSTVTTIGKEAFYCETLKHVELNSNSLVSTNYTEDGSLDAFFGEKVEEYVLGPDVKSIGRYAFSGCTGLKTIVLSENMDRIRDNAFEGCDELEEIHILNPEPPIVLENSFSQDAYKYAVLYVPEGSQEVYKADEVWKKFSRVRTTDMAAKDCRLTLKGFNGGTVALQCRTKASYTFELKPEAGWIVSSIMFNGTDVTNEMSAGSYTTPSLTGDSELAIVFEQGNNGVRDAMVYSQIHISAYNAELNIRNDGNTTVQADVYTTDGRIVKRVSVSNGTTIIPLTNNKTYLVKVGSKTYKVAF